LLSQQQILSTDS